MRYTVNHNDPTFTEISQRIDRAVIEHYAGNDAIIGWHIDNEISGEDACDGGHAGLIYLHCSGEEPFSNGAP